jgi:hypothetical protein
MRIRKALAAICAASCVVPFGASAALISTFDTLADWQTAAGSPITLEDFNDATLAPGLSLSSGTLPGSALLDEAPPLAISTGGLDFAPGITAFSADWTFNSNFGQFAVVAQFADATTSTVGVMVTPTPGFVWQAFFGFVSDTPVTGIRYLQCCGDAGLFIIDDARFVAVAGDDSVSVPEPSTLSLAVLAMSGLWAARRRRAS